MTVHLPGDVVFLEYPFTSPGGSKRRPALVLLDVADGDLLLARVTSSAKRNPLDVRLRDWRAAGLFSASHVKLGKLLMVAESEVIRKFGALSPGDRAQVGHRLSVMFERDWPLTGSSAQTVT